MKFKVINEGYARALDTSVDIMNYVTSVAVLHGNLTNELNQLKEMRFDADERKLKNSLNAICSELKVLIDNCNGLSQLAQQIHDQINVSHDLGLPNYTNGKDIKKQKMTITEKGIKQ